MSTGTPFPQFRCAECTLVRCYAPGMVCEECRANAAQEFDRVQQQRARPVEPDPWAELYGYRP